MKLHYYPEADSLYIELADKPSVDSREVSPGVVVDYDEDDHVVGIDIDRASKSVVLSRLETQGLLFPSLTFSAPVE